MPGDEWQKNKNIHPPPPTLLLREKKPIPVMTDNETMGLETMVGGVTTTSAMECNGPGCKLWESVLLSPEDSISFFRNQFFTKPSGLKKKKEDQ